MTTQVSAQAAPTTKPSFRPRAFVPEIEYKGNIEKAKGLIKDGKFAEAADVVRDNAFAPDFLIGDITRMAEPSIITLLLADFSDFALRALKPENVEKRGIRLSALLRAMARFNASSYFSEKAKVITAVKAVSAKIPTAVTNSCEEIEAKLKRTLSTADWMACGFEVKSENVGQLVIYHPGLKQSITVYRKVEGQKPIDKESKRRARQLERAALCPGKIGVSGGKKQDDGGKKGKKK